MDQRKCVLRIVVLLLAVSSSAFAQGNLENPTPNSFQSGQGIISGWHCQATTIEIVVDGTIRVQAPYGTLRGDTLSSCGDVNNGFGFQVNWNELGDGTHTVVVLADGIQFGQATFTVKTLGVPHLSGASGSYQLQGFAGKNVTIQWSEPLQNFVITGWSPSDGGGGNADLQALLGRWQFTYTISSTFQQTYSFDSIQTAGGVTAIAGTDSSGDLIVVIRTADAGVSFPYTFFLLDPGVNVCQGFAFNQTGSNTVTGIYVQISVLANGDCGSVSSNLYDMTGVRLNTALLSPSKSSAALEAQAQLEDKSQSLQPLPNVNTQHFSQFINRAYALLH